VHGVIKSDHSFYNPGQPIWLDLSLKNRQPTPVTLIAGQNGIIIKIHMQEFFPQGHCQEQTFSQIIPLEGEFVLSSQESWQKRAKISTPAAGQISYRIFQIQGYIPRCQIRYQTQTFHPRIELGDITVSSLPQVFQEILQKPLATCLWALQLGYPEHLFFASFFLDKEGQAKTIPVLIQSLEIRENMDTVILNILRRWTGKDFASKNLWLHYWRAYQSFWEENIPKKTERE
jgi:hypothetical protein